MKLRPYQVDIIEQTRALMRQGVRAILIQSPTGSGKTALTAEMMRLAVGKGKRAWFNVHRRELVKQSIRAFSVIPHGVISSNFLEAKRLPIQIASIQTLVKRYHLYQAPDLIAWDECHHLAAGSWEKIFKAFPNAFHIGLTATPERLDGKGLKKFFTHMIEGPTVAWLIENGYLVPYKLYAPSGVNVSGVHTQMGDFVKAELTKIVDRPSITGDAIKHYRKYADGKRAVVFCVSIEHSKHVVSQFLAAGIPAEHVDGETDIEIRDSAIKRFEAGTTKILSNVELFGEGFDLPALECAILLRPTQSLGMYLQQVGRALRTHPGKTHAVILDHAGNCQRHGLPDEERQWSLDGRSFTKRPNMDGGPSVKVCPKCFAAQFAGIPKCKQCGYVYPVIGREVEQKEGDLVEVDPEVIRRQKNVEQARATSLDDLIALGRKRGFKKPEAWAHHIFQARQLKKLQGAGR